MGKYTADWCTRITGCTWKCPLWTYNVCCICFLHIFQPISPLHSLSKWGNNASVLLTETCTAVLCTYVITFWIQII